MNKREFIDELCKRLRHVSADEAQRLVNFVSESIDDRMEEGMSEEEAVAAVGSIDDLVREVGGEAELKTASQPFSGGQNGGKKKDYVVTSDNIRQIVLTEGNGDVVVRSSKDDKLHIHVTESDRTRYAVTKKGGVLTVTKEQNADAFRGLRFDLDLDLGFFKFSSSGDDGIVAELPDALNADITVKTGSGDIRYAFGGSTALRLTTGSGDVTVGSCAVFRSAEVATGSGDLKARELMGDAIALTTSSGDIDLGSVTANSLRLSTVSGDCDVKEAFVRDKVIARTVSGDLSLKMESPLAVGSFESVSGDLDIDLYGCGERYHLSLSSVSGRVKAPASDDSAQNAIRARTTSGDITVRVG